MVKCINCNEAGSCKEKFICYEMKSNYWFKEVLNITTNCDHFNPVIDVGDRHVFTYPQLNKFKYEKIKTIFNTNIVIGNI